MDFFEVVHTRRSIRKFTNQAIAPQYLDTILRAAMSSPTATNSQSWSFVVIDDKEILSEIPSLHPYAGYAAYAPVSVLVCGDTTVGKAPSYWPQDAAAATQTLMLAARALGIGSVWCGIHTSPERELMFRNKFGLPEHICPFSLVVLGYPEKDFYPEDRYNPVKIHRNHW